MPPSELNPRIINHHQLNGLESFIFVAGWFAHRERSQKNFSSPWALTKNFRRPLAHSERSQKNFQRPLTAHREWAAWISAHKPLNLLNNLCTVKFRKFMKYSRVIHEFGQTTINKLTPKEKNQLVYRSDWSRRKWTVMENQSYFQLARALLIAKDICSPQKLVEGILRPKISINDSIFTSFINLLGFVVFVLRIYTHANIKSALKSENLQKSLFNVKSMNQCRSNGLFSKMFIQEIVICRIA